MLELGSLGEILIITIAALILIGPKEIPNVLRTFGRWTQRLRHLTSNLRQSLDHYIQEGEFEEYQNMANRLKNETQEDSILDQKKGS